MAVGRCLNCSAVKEMKLLKKCGGCGLVLYCSTECQKISWKTTHKYSCVSVAPLPSIGSKDFDKWYNKTVDRWVHEWRGILEGYSVAALDLANHPGRHVTHATCLDFKYTGNKVPARRFEFMSGRVCPVDEILSQQPNLKVLRDPPGLSGPRVRCVMTFHYAKLDDVTMCKVRAEAWTDPSLNTKWYSMDPPVSALLAETIFESARLQIEKGDPDKMRAGEAILPFRVELVQ